MFLGPDAKRTFRISAINWRDATGWLGTLPGKKPLIQFADRPPNYEAPLEYLRTPIKPNDQFFVRYHLADIPEVIPVGKFPFRDRFITQENAASTPIIEMVVNSLITSHRDGDKAKAGNVTVSGMAWDGGYGISSVQVSTDGGKSWSSAACFAMSTKKGKNTVMVNATNKLGQSQTSELIFNSAGYHNNVMQNITLTA